MKSAAKMDMTQGPIMRKVLAFALPICAGNVLQQLYSTVDTVVIGNFCGSTSLAAVGTSSQPVELLLCIFLGIGTGVSILVSQFVGNGNEKKLREIMETSVFFLYMCAIPLSVAGQFIGPLVLKIMQVPEDTWAPAVSYIAIIFWGTLGNMGYNMNAGILRGLGDLTAAGAIYNTDKGTNKEARDMGAVFDKKELLVLLQDFYELTGLRTVVFDEWGVDVLSYPSDLPAFCQLVRATPEGALGCRLCDQKACRQARQERKTLIYPCHAGLIEAITPIQVDGVVVGYLLLSHIVQGADEDAEWCRARELCRKYGIAEEDLSKAYRQLPRTPYRILRAAGDLLSFSAQALCQAQMARLVPGSLKERLNHFVSEHLAEDLSSERICTALGVGRTALYELSKQTYGCGIHEYVRQLRIRHAMQLLTTTKLTNSEICQKIGIADYNYFFRVFRKQTGFTPQAYRKQFGETD